MKQTHCSLYLKGAIWKKVVNGLAAEILCFGSSVAGFEPLRPHLEVGGRLPNGDKAPERFRLSIGIRSDRF